MKKLILVYVVLVVIVILLAVFKGGGNLLSFIPSFGKTATATVNGTKLNLLVAKSDQDRVKGLSGRKSLDKNQGMIFIFDHKDKYGFWMKDMLFPIDIIYIDTDHVVYVVRNAPAGGQLANLTVYRPDDPANYVLEVNAGIADKLKIQKGTTIKLDGVK
ncbi:MAG TPA: DUF192 domain-containing protein [Patescibacteria group bacterium]|nr:DUF192 domain-containing protein [Patescibacteria group bacterium]